MTSRFICTLASSQRAEPLYATASTVRRWLLIEVNGSWGPDAIVESELGPHAPSVWRRAMRQRGVRVLAVRRDLDQAGAPRAPGVRLVFVESGRPGVRESSAFRIVVDGLHGVVHATQPILDTGGPDESWEVDPEPYVLVCTNGRHDACCATEGRPLVRHLRESERAKLVWESSHIGGDRFAANVLVLPRGLYFGRCTPDDVDDTLDALGDGRLDLTHFRGRSTFSWLEQAAEHFLRREHGLAGLDVVAAAATLDEARVALTLDDGRTATVTVERSDVPVDTPLTCRGRDGQTIPVFQLQSIQLQ